jgi:hypothetical protein
VLKCELEGGYNAGDLLHTPVRTEEKLFLWDNLMIIKVINLRAGYGHRILLVEVRRLQTEEFVEHFVSLSLGTHS